MVVVADIEDEDEDEDAFGCVVVVTTRAAVVGGETARSETSVSRGRPASPG